MNNAEDIKTVIDFWNTAYKDEKAYNTESGMGCEYLDGKLKMLAGHKRVLDFGCGSGWASLIMAKLGCPGVTGVDTSEKAIEVCRESSIMSGTESSTEFICGNETVLDGCVKFDACFSSNTLDVVPEETCISIISRVSDALEPGSPFILMLNAYADGDRFEKIGMERLHDNYYAKNGVLRCVNRDFSEWEALLSKDFECVEKDTFRLDGEPEWYKRRLMHLIKK